MQNSKSLAKLKKDGKAISPLITTLLLVAVAVSASVITYSWVMSMVGSQSQQTQTQIRIDDVTWDTSDDNCTIVIRNIGSVDAKIGSIAISYSPSGSTFYTHSFTSSNSIATGTTTSLLWSESSASAPTGFVKTSTEYLIRIVTSTGFQYETFSTTPSA
jgi:flagellin-like protein